VGMQQFTQGMDFDSLVVVVIVVCFEQMDPIVPLVAAMGHLQMDFVTLLFSQMDFRYHHYLVTIIVEARHIQCSTTLG